MVCKSLGVGWFNLEIFILSSITFRYFKNIYINLYTYLKNHLQYLLLEACGYLSRGTDFDDETVRSGYLCIEKQK